MKLKILMVWILGIVIIAAGITFSMWITYSIATADIPEWLKFWLLK